MSETNDQKFLSDFYKAKRRKSPFSSLSEMKPYYTKQGLWEGKTSDRRALSKKTFFCVLLFFVLAPVTIYIGTRMEGRTFYPVSIFLVTYGMIPFFLQFEGRKPKTRELVVVALFVALTVAGRSAFYMLPNVKPVVALVMIAGIAFGGETGFLVGSLSMLVSNFFFGHGAWTPYQMFALGMIGFLSGWLYQRRIIRPGRLSVCFFGFLFTIFIYGGIMNLSTAFMSMYQVTWATLLGYYISGLPIDIIHGISTVIFLWFGSRPLLEIIGRIRLKYGL